MPSSAPEEPSAADLKRMGDNCSAFSMAQEDMYGEKARSLVANARDYYQRASDGGDTDAMFLLGGMLFGSTRPGLSWDDDGPAALALFERAAALGNMRAVMRLAAMHSSGEELVEFDPAKAVGLYARAEQNGEVKGRYELALCFEDGTGVEEDLSVAIFLLERCCVDETLRAKHVDAALHLSGIYVNGDDGVKKFGRAAELLQKLLDLAEDEGWGMGDSVVLIATRRLLKIYSQGGHGVSQDWEKAAGFLKELADSGCFVSAYRLGMLYEEGRGVPQSDESAAEMMMKSSDGGYVFAFGKMACFYEDGKGVEKDLVEAARLYEEAVRRSQFEFAERYMGLC